MAGTETKSKLCLGLEPTWLGLKPSQNPQCLVSGPNETRVLGVSWQKELSERQSDRLEVDLFRFREKQALQIFGGKAFRAEQPTSAKSLRWEESLRINLLIN